MRRFAKSSVRLWETWRLSKTYRCLPSELLGVVDELAAYCVNRAVAAFGTALEADLHKAAEGKKGNGVEAAHAMVFHRWLGTPMKFATPVPTRR